MIVTHLTNAREQMALTPGMRKALDFLNDASGKELPDGRVELDGNRVFALVQSYQTLPAGDEVLFEAHRDYIDVQYVARGREIMGWAPAEQLASRVAYDPANEAWLATLPAQVATFVRLEAGYIAVLHPADAHAPRLAAGAPAGVKKIVVKVAVATDKSSGHA